jgi:hypothetical protein
LIKTLTLFASHTQIQRDTGTPRYYAQFSPIPTLLGRLQTTTYQTELHYYYYPTTIVQGGLAGFGTITPGSGYTNGIYEGVALTGGDGSNGLATITVSGGIVTAVTLTNPGFLYLVGNTLSAATSTIGGTGSGFSVPVNNIQNAAGTSGWVIILKVFCCMVRCVRLSSSKKVNKT